MSPPPTTSDSPPANDHNRWFAEQVHAHESQLKAYLRVAFPAVRDVEDIVQESYLRVWKRKTVQPIHSARAFLFRVARNVALDLVRRERISPLKDLGDAADLSVIEEKGTDTSDERQKIDLLGRAISTLPARCREIIIRHKIRGLSQRQVAEEFGVSEKTVENQVSIGVKRCEAYFRRCGVEHF